MTTLEGVQHQSLELLTVTLEQLRPSMMRYGTRRLGLPYHVVEDCVEDTYLKIDRSIRNGFVLDVQRPAKYIRTTFVSVCIDYYNRSSPRARREVPFEEVRGECLLEDEDDEDDEYYDPASTDPTPLEIAAEEDVHSTVQQAVASLSPFYHDLVVLYAHGDSNQAIAQQHKISLSTLKVRLHGAKEILKSRLSTLLALK